VLDVKGRLIGIVNGGLNRGAAAYNWVIPAKYLDELVASTTDQVPNQVARVGDNHFASGFAEETAQSVVEYNSLSVDYSWVLTKTQSLEELAASADDAEGVAFLYQAISELAQLPGDASEFIFDIYEELEFGLVIAVPTGQGLTFTDLGDGLGYWLVSQNQDESAGFNGIRFNHGYIKVRNQLGEAITPSDPNYFTHFATEKLIECHVPGVSYCELIPEFTRKITFGRTEEIVRFAIFTFDFMTSELVFGDYYTMATSGEFPFLAQARIYRDGETGLLQCLLQQDEKACSNLAASKTQLMQLLGVHLTSFTNLEIDQQILETDFNYNSTWDDPSTVFVPYVERDQIRFFNTRGKLWRVYLNTEGVEATEIRRENGNVILQYENIYYSVPVAGGQYYQSTPQNTWAVMGSVQPVTAAAPTSYLENGNLRFVYFNGQAWRVYFDQGNFIDTTETKRTEADDRGPFVTLKAGDLFYSIPIRGGTYYQSVLGGTWSAAGTIQVQSNE
jgi:hypothetical protein